LFDLAGHVARFDEKQIVEIEDNPQRVIPDGQGAVIVDRRLRVIHLPPAAPAVSLVVGAAALVVGPAVVVVAADASLDSVVVVALPPHPAMRTTARITAIPSAKRPTIVCLRRMCTIFPFLHPRAD
jgi:hypothetical protein